MNRVNLKHLSDPLRGSVHAQAMTGLSLVNSCQSDMKSDQYQAIKEYVLQLYGPTLRFKEMLKVLCISRSKAYELMQSDLEFPSGIPLYDGENSPKFYWTHEVLVWLEVRSNKFRSQQEGI